MIPTPPSQPSFTPRRKWGVGLDVVVRSLVVLAVVVMVNHLASVFYHRQTLNESQKAELSPQTRNLLQTLTNEIKVTIYYDRNERFYPNIAGVLREYQALNPKVRVETVDYLSDAAAAKRVKLAHQLPETDKAEEKNFVIFECEGRKRQIPGTWIVDYTVERIDNAEQFEYQRKPIALKAETLFTAALLAVTSPKLPKAYVLQGHGGHNLNSGDEVTGYLDFKALLQQNAILVEPLSLAGGTAVPQDCNLLIIPGPRSVLPEVELKRIEQYLDEGGRLFALFNADATGMVGLEQLLAEKWGIGVSSYVVTDRAHAISQDETDIMVGAFSRHPAVIGLINFNLNLQSPRIAGALPVRDDLAHAPKVEVLFETANTATVKGNAKIAPRAFPLAVALEKKPVAGVVTGRGITRMIVVGDSYFLANGPMKLVANRDFAGYALNWLLDRPQFVEGIGPKPFVEYRMTLTAEQRVTLLWLLLGALPGGILMFGGLVWWRRRK